MGYTRIYDGSTCLKRAVDFHCHESGPQIKEGTVCSRDGASQRHTTAPPPPPPELTKRSCETRAKRPHVCAGGGDATCTTRSGGWGSRRPSHVSLHFPPCVSLLEHAKQHLTYFLFTISNVHLKHHHTRALPDRENPPCSYSILQVTSSTTTLDDRPAAPRPRR